MEERKTIGEKILARLRNSDRVGARLAVSRTSFDDRFERYGRPRGMSRFGMSLFPDHQSEVARPTWEQGDDVEYLSGAPYWDRLRRLGNARLRRQQRFSALENRFAQRRELSAVRRAPDFGSLSGARSIPFFGLSALALDDLSVLTPEKSASEDESQPISAWGETVSKKEWKGAPVSDSPWLTGTFNPARVAASGKDKERSSPLERIAARVPATTKQIEEVRRVVERLVEAKPVSQQGPESTDAPLPSSGASRRINRVQRTRPSPVRAAAADYEAALPDDFLPPSQHAKGRLAERRGRRRGLKPVMSSSPLMTALEPVSPELSQSVFEATETQQRSFGTTGQTAARRVAHRIDDSTATSLLSTSPVRKPSMVAPSAVTLQSQMETRDLEATQDNFDSTTGRTKASQRVLNDPRSRAVSLGEVESPTMGADRKPVAPMVRAIARSQSPAEPLVERPLSERLPVASRPVQTRTGMFAPERLVLTPDVVPTEVTADAIPEVAERIAQRNTAAAHAAARTDAPFGEAAASAVVTRSEARVVDAGTESDSGTEEGAASTQRTRRHRIVRTSTGSYAPESVVLSAQESQSAETIEDAQALSNQQASQPVSRAAERLDAVTGSVGEPNVGRSSRRTRPPSVETSVLKPSAKPGENIPAGLHAASRVKKSPVIGYTAAKAVGNIKQEAAQQSSQWAPSRSLNPVRHASITRKHRLSADKNAVTITLPSQPVEPGVGEQAGAIPAIDRRVLATEIQSAQESREYSGRPLDWSNARIEVMQVPAQQGTPAAQTDPVRMLRNEDGAYVPAQSTRGNTRSAQTATTGVLPKPVGSSQAIEEQNDESVEGMSPSSRRTGFSNTVEGIGAGQVHTGMPIWAHRSTGMPRIRGAEDLVTELARASAPSDVVEILMNKSDGMAKATSALPQPVIQVIQQLKTEATRTENELERERSEESTRERVRGRGGVRSTTRVARGMTGLSPRGSSSKSASAGMDKVSKLAQRLQELIAMAESQNRSGARREVRMAEDSAAAKSEGQSAAGAPESGRDVSVDIETLAREVTEQVTRELEMRRERRQEDPDGRSIWW